MTKFNSVIEMLIEQHNKEVAELEAKIERLKNQIERHKKCDKCSNKMELQYVCENCGHRTAKLWEAE